MGVRVSGEEPADAAISEFLGLLCHRSIHGRNEPPSAVGGQRSVRSRHVEPNGQNIAVLDDVLFPFEPHQAALARFVETAACDQSVVGDHFGADETAREIGVNRARGVQRARADGNRPRAHLVLADGEKRLQAKQSVRQTNDFGESRFGDAIFREKFARVLRWHLRDFHFEFALQRREHRLLVIVLDDSVWSVHRAVADVQHDELRFDCRQREIFDEARFVVTLREVEIAQGLSVFKMRLESLK